MGNFSNGEKPTIWGAGHIKKKATSWGSHKKLNMESSCNLGNYEKTCIEGNSWKKELSILQSGEILKEESAAVNTVVNLHHK